MLVNPKELIACAQAENYAIGAFNTYNLEITLGIILGAEFLHAPIILQVGSSALKYGGNTPLIGLAVEAAKKTSVPVAVHLDHARDFETLRLCLDQGFTSCMFDGSNLSLEENIELTRQAAELVQKWGAPLEGELGAIAGEEDSADAEKNVIPYTDPDQAKYFVHTTGVDILAIAIGNAHGFYKATPKLDFERLARIRELVSIPLALHGASGIEDEEIRKAIHLGICKINVNTDLRSAFFEALKVSLGAEHSGYNLPDLMIPSIQSVAEAVATKISLFGSNGKG